MKVRLLPLVGAAAAAGIAGAALQPTAPAPTRNIAVIHLHAQPRATQPLTPAMLRGPQEQTGTATGPSRAIVRPAATARPVRPLFPWWFKRRHVAAPQPAIA